MNALRPPSWKWWITALLLLATTINYMDRVALSAASVRVTRELSLSDAQYGHLELAFGWAFAAGSLVFGFLADRFRIYWLYPVVLGAWSLVGLSTGWAQGFTGLLLCRTALGFFEAGHWPCALKTTFALLSERDRTMGNSVLQSGASLGAIITPQIMRLLITPEPGSWRSTFMVVGATGFLWVLAWFLSLRPRDLETAPASSPKASLLHLILSHRFLALALLILGTQTVWHIFRVWLLKFLQTGRGYEEAAALNFTSAYYLATDLGCLLAGALSMWFIRRGYTPHHSGRLVYSLGCLLTAQSVLLPFLPKGAALLTVLLIIGAGALALFPCFYSFVQELSAEHVGRLTGLLSLFVWAVTSPLHSLFGVIADRTHRYDYGLALAGLAPWLGVLALALLWRPDPPKVIASVP